MIYRTVIMLAACLAAAAQPSMPAWLAPFPGAEVRKSAALVSVSYGTAAPIRDVIDHYKQLFTNASLPFHPSQDGVGFAVRAAAPECDLLLQVREGPSGTEVQIHCAARMPAPPPAPRPRDRSGAEEVRNMEKFDRPVSPKPKAAVPLAWPDWLAALDGGSPAVHTGVDRFNLRYLETEFDTARDLSEVRAYYAELLGAHGYAELPWNYVRPRDGIGVVEGTHRLPGDSGSRLVIHCEFAPRTGGLHATLRITARP